MVVVVVVVAVAVAVAVPGPNTKNTEAVYNNQTKKLQSNGMWDRRQIIPAVP
jgi:hypothetical protein